MRLHHLLLIFLFASVLSSYVSADSENESLQKVITAPLRNSGSNVIDGSGTEYAFSSGNDDPRGGSSRVSVSTVAFFTLAMAAATGLGALPFFFVDLDPQWSGICNGMAAGVMLAASFDLIQEGQDHGSGSWVVFGILTGGIFISLCKKFLDHYGEVSMLDIKGADAAKAVLVIGIMTLHSFGEGAGVGVSFAGSKGLSQGLLVTLAIAVHNIPEGLAVSMVLASKGVPPHKAMLWSIITSLPQPIVAVPSFVCADAFNKFLPFATGFAAGCMIWMVMAEVLPDGLKGFWRAGSFSIPCCICSYTLCSIYGRLKYSVPTLRPQFQIRGRIWFSYLSTFWSGPAFGRSISYCICSCIPPSACSPNQCIIRDCLCPRCLEAIATPLVFKNGLSISNIPPHDWICIFTFLNIKCFETQRTQKDHFCKFFIRHGWLNFKHTDPSVCPLLSGCCPPRAG
ncbi:unnamed protein product [Cuscuta epithymum]|uniref:Zinc transporter n=1 Tax=Cuscuta epithymum TaxID=186058 RepID=A0AAV0EJY9_9ASTE|nr:unnamed protein product [Cuscuta epithymum]